jgi:nucleotide-binding universal stress UspA family protein
MNTPTSGPVVVGVDGLPGSAGAVRYAVTEAARRDARLRLVHVVPDFATLGPPVPLSELRSVGESILEREVETVRGLAPDLDVDSVLARGERDHGVVCAAEDAQLLVVGRETRQGLDRLLTGTTTARVASHAPCDVVVVPSFWVDRRRRGRVVVGLKSRRNSRELLARAFAEAASRDAALRVVMAWEVADPYFDRIELRTHADEWEANGRELIVEVTADWRTAYPDVTVETTVVHGQAAKVLLQASGDSDLLIISRRKLALPPYGHLGGIGHSLLRLSDVPVHVVPYAADAADAEDLVLEAEGAPLR